MVRRDLLPGSERLLLSGGERTITAEVLGVTRNLRTAGEKTTYYIVCRYKEPLTGRTETYTSRALDEYPGKEVIGRKVTVRIDPGEKGKYTVDIDALFGGFLTKWERRPFTCTRTFTRALSRFSLCLFPSGRQRTSGNLSPNM